MRKSSLAGEDADAVFCIYVHISRHVQILIQKYTQVCIISYFSTFSIYQFKLKDQYEDLDAEFCRFHHWNVDPSYVEVRILSEHVDVDANVR